MKTNKLAVYGTLRDGKRDTWKVDGYSLVFPGHRNYPAAFIDENQNEMVVEIIDVDDMDLAGYDQYEGVSYGLYERRMVKAYNDDDEVISNTDVVYLLVMRDGRWRVKGGFVDGNLTLGRD